MREIPALLAVKAVACLSEIRSAPSSQLRKAAGGPELDFGALAVPALKSPAALRAMLTNQRVRPRSACASRSRCESIHSRNADSEPAKRPSLTMRTLLPPKIIVCRNAAG